MRYILALLIVFTLTTQAKGERWMLVAESDNTYYYIDASSVKKMPNNTCRAWNKYVYKKPFEGVSSAVSYGEYDCFEKKHRDLQSTFFNQAGEVEVQNNAIEPWIYATPDSAGESVVIEICRYCEQKSKKKGE